MSEPPALLVFGGDWSTYEELVYQAFLETLVRADVRFQGYRVKAPYRPESRGKHFSFWHLISEAPNTGNRNEEDRIPDIQRCERVRWISWVIQQADAEVEQFSWWENRRGRDTHVVIWAEGHDFAVILGKRSDYFVLKTAYCNLKSGRRKVFGREREQFWRARKG